MGNLEALERYRSYLESIEREAPEPSQAEEYLELLAPGEAIDLLCARDALADSQLDAYQAKELRRLDQLLKKHGRLIRGNIDPPGGKPETHWWWFLGAQAKTRGR